MSKPTLASTGLLGRLVLPYVDSFQSSAILFRCNKEWNAQLTAVDGVARVAWVEMAAEMTACTHPGFVPSEIKKQLGGIRDRKEFISDIRSLICPWTNEAVNLIKLEFENKMITRDMYLTEDNTQIVFHTSEPVHGWAGIVSYRKRQVSYPSTPCENFVKTVAKLPTQPPPPPPSSGQDAMVGGERVETDGFRFIRVKGHGHLDMYEFTGMPKTQVKFKYVLIHGGVMAVMAFSKHLSRMQGLYSNSIYFVSIPEGRMLVHMSLHSGAKEDGSVILSRPGRMWTMANGHVKYYGRNPVTDSVRLAYPWERVDEAFAMIIQGDAEGAMRFLRRDMKCDIDTILGVNQRTLVHYAVAFDQPRALDVLLENGASPYRPDKAGMTPLEIACYGFKHECVRSIVESSFPIADACWKDQWEAGWNRVCDAENLETFFKKYPEKTAEYLEVLIPNTVAALWSGVPVMPIDAGYSHAMKGFRSRSILSSEKALKFLLQRFPTLMGRFSVEGGFKCMLGVGMTYNEIQADSVLKAMSMAVREFGLDINSQTGVTIENHIVWAVRLGSLKCVKFLIEELGADVRSHSVSGDSIMHIAVKRAEMRAENQEPRKILKYLTEEVEGIPSLSAQWGARRILIYESY